jgi:hypothetical protein
MKATRAAFYRASQFFAALKTGFPAGLGRSRAGMVARDRALITAALPTASQRDLFNRMPPNDQRHALAVARTLRQAGYHQRDIIQAALLHDVAKSIGQPLPHRVLIVLLEAFWPAALGRLSALTGIATGSQVCPNEADLRRIAWWRRPFAVHACHAALGAAWAQAVDCEPLAVSLIARHQKPIGSEDSLLAALQWADNLN